jgi:hypothetical protein
MDRLKEEARGLIGALGDRAVASVLGSGPCGARALVCAPGGRSLKVVRCHLAESAGNAGSTAP